MALPRQQVLARARAIQALVLDVDGVLTDARLYYGPRGEALKAFSARDGFAIKLAQSEGIVVAILSGRLAPPLKARLADLGIGHPLVIEGSRNKRRDLATLARRLKLGLGEVAYVGDDLPDLPALADAGLAVCPADASDEVRSRCHYICQAAGGRGAVREVVKLLLMARGRWDALVADWEAGRASASWRASGAKPADGN